MSALAGGHCRRCLDRLRPETSAQAAEIAARQQLIRCGLEVLNAFACSASGQWKHTLEGHVREIWNVAFSPDGSLLASAGWDRDVRLWDAKAGVCLRTLEGRHDNWVLGVAFDPTGILLASASYDKAVRIWAPMSGECLRTLEGHVDAVNGVAFSPAGSLLASASSDKTVRLWAAPTNNREEPR